MHACRSTLEDPTAPHADTLLERLAAEHRGSEEVVLVSSDTTLRATAGQEVRSLTAAGFLGELGPASHAEGAPSRLADRLEPGLRARLERLRRGR